MPSQIKRYDGDQLQFSTSIEVSTRAKELQRMTDMGMRNALAAVANSALEHARYNVTAPHGPGPHPHRTDHGWVWDDTGQLADSLRIRFVQKGFIRTATVFTPFDYGMYLELGWRGPSGRFYRYPWLKLAFQKAQGEFPKFVKAWFTQAIEEANHRHPEVYGNNWVNKMVNDFEMNKSEFDANFIPDSTLRAQISDALAEVSSVRERTRNVLRAMHRAARGQEAQSLRSAEIREYEKQRNKSRQKYAHQILKKHRQPGTGKKK